MTPSLQEAEDATYAGERKRLPVLHQQHNSIPACSLTSG